MRGPIPVLPARIPSYNAGSAVRVPYVSRDHALEEVTPSSARYRVDDLTNSRVVADWTTIDTPAARGAVIVSATLNAMQRACDLERRQVTFEFTDSDGNVRQELAHYELAAVYTGATS